MVPKRTPCYGGRSLAGVMTTAPPEAPARRGIFDVDEERATEAFQLTWGQAYDIAFTGGAWQARRRDGRGTVITGTTPDALTVAIRADWARRSPR